jgi:putative transposase
MGSHEHARARAWGHAHEHAKLKRIEANEDVNILRAQRRSPPPSLEDIERQCGERNVAMVAAHATGGYSYQRIGAHFGVHFTTVAKVVRRAKTGR